MTAKILDYRHWQAARERRATRQRAKMRARHTASSKPIRLSLDDIIGPAFDPTGGAA